MLAVYLDVENGKEPEIIDIEDDLDTYYEFINCSCIDIVTRKIGKKHFTIICDDEGTFKDDPRISAIDDFGITMLVGNLIIVSPENENGELVELTEKEAEYIIERIQHLYTTKHPEGYYILTQCSY